MSCAIRKWVAKSLFIITISFCGAAVAVPAIDVLVISSKSSVMHVNVEHSVVSYLDSAALLENGGKLRYHNSSIEGANQKIQALKPDLIVTIGSRAMKQYWHINTPRLYAFVTFNTFSQLYTTQPIANDHYGIIFLDQPLDRQLDLARKIIPEARVGLLLSSQSTSAASAYLSSQVLAADNNIVVSYVDEKEQLVDQAKLLLNDVDILLATPDAAVWQPSSAKWLLYLAYQQGKPVVGFSEALTRAGTIASVYSEPEQIGRQIAEAIKAFSEGRVDWQKNTGPKYYQHSVNESIANSLGISDAILNAIKEKAN